MPTYSVFTPLDTDGASAGDLLARFLAMQFRQAGTLDLDGPLEEHVRPGNLYIEHRTGTVYAGATMLLTMSFGGSAIGTAFSYPVTSLGDLFALTGYDAFAGRDDSPDAVPVRIYAINESVVDRTIRTATDGRIQNAGRNDTDSRPVRIDLDNAELVRFVTGLYGHACAGCKESHAPNHRRIPLSSFYAAILPGAD